MHIVSLLRAGYERELQGRAGSGPRILTEEGWEKGITVGGKGNACKGVADR